MFLLRKLLSQPMLRVTAHQGDALMHIAIQEGHIEIVKILVNNGVDAIVYHTTNVFLASSLGHLDIVKFFLEIKNASISVSQNAFLRACRNGHIEVAKFFLPSVDNNTQQCGLLEGCTKNYSIIVKMLLSHNIDPSFFSNAPIRIASRMGHLEIVRMLLECNTIDPGDLNNYSIHHAALGEHWEVIKLLVKDPRVNPRIVENSLSYYCRKDQTTKDIRKLMGLEQI